MKIIGRITALCLIVGALMGFSISSASAHNIGLKGTPFCLSDGSWKVPVTVDITNTPSSGNGSQSEVKATKPTGSPGVTTEGGFGVLSGGQVILNSWAEHASNWPGVKTRTGNYSDHYMIVVPASVNSVETEVQIDWKGWGSDDPKKTFYKPSGCEAEHGIEKEARNYTPPVDCDSHFKSTYMQERSRTWTMGEGGVKIYDAWTEWLTTSTIETIDNPDFPCITKDQEQQFRHFSVPGTCATNPQTGVVYQERHRTVTVDHGVKTYGAWSAWKTYRTVYPNRATRDCTRHANTRVKVTDNCSCRDDHVRVFWNHDKVRVTKERINRMTWQITVAGKYDKKTGLQYLVPSRIGGSHGWSTGTIYTIHTTAKPCPCRLRGDCKKIHPNFSPPHNCVGRADESGGVTCK